ncbi:aminoglycoside phosphotransferase family protein [Catenovulum sp. 2E275]|uniref:aminoglycoside phosphotransferase family protein n=1 Tax=Catenovulum sp. 2E275 TaxID=2980497 RepID=UPI0021D05723|nr:aminoglycoside phosphotransferase family protein [Catenovulum sp. 2E275]MCU4677554.1 aminoglycoside phosphotransferase family protein [Catenovulum sp. 2E275]
MIDKAQLTQSAYADFATRERIIEILGVKGVTVQDGGLFNSILKLNAGNRDYYFKQYLDGVHNETYSHIPNLPANVRMNLAVEVQQLANKIVRNLANVNVPDILHVDEVSNSFLMESAVSNDSFYSTLESGDLKFGPINSLAFFLASFHSSTFRSHDNKAESRNRVFRDFKLKIQYEDIALLFDENTANKIIECVAAYKQTNDCILHGDLNSRNILTTNDEISVIDFEQSHTGSPVYDVAYILCEILISLYVYGRENITEYLKSFYTIYTGLFPEFVKTNQSQNLLCHLGVQVIYRFLGPSRNHWTAYVDESHKAELIELSQEMIHSESEFCDFFQRFK